MHSREYYKIERTALLVLTCFALISLAMAISSCSSLPVVDTSKTYQTKGWSPDFDTYIKSQVTPNLLNQTQDVMGQFCAEWSTLSQDQRKQFYADVLYSIALPESDYDRGSLYYETSLGNDAETGLPVVSEGFLQLSYQDIEAYPKCQFDANKDKSFIQDDWAARGGHTAWESKHPNDKTILNPFTNLACGVVIFDKLLSTNNTKEFADRLGAYWSSMRRSHSDTYSQIWQQMRARNSPCH